MNATSKTWSESSENKEKKFVEILIATLAVV